MPRERKCRKPNPCTKSHLKLRASIRSADVRQLSPRQQLCNAKMIQVRHRSHATHSRQPRQARKEARVTGSCVLSQFPVSDFNFFHAKRSPVPRPLITEIYIFFTTLFARN